MTSDFGKSKNNIQSGISVKYALCIVDVKNLGIRTFSYIIPPNLTGEIKQGQAVIVPFGSTNRHVTAFVARFSDSLEKGVKAKEIIGISDKKSVLSSEFLKLLEFCANYYCCDLNTVIRAAIPMKFLKATSSAVKKEKTEKYLIFVTKENAASRNLEILSELEKYSKVPLIQFEKTVKTTRQTILKLCEKGFAKISEEVIYRDPLNVFDNIENTGEFTPKGNDDYELEKFPPLSDEQQKAFEHISKKIESGKFFSVLINGITGSGKTEIYFNAVKKVLDSGKNVLFLVPEIALASQLTLRFIKRFGRDKIAIWHSSISEGEKFDVWNKIRDNAIRIIIGARSAVFAPLNNIGAVIIDEEHESAFKQISPAPRYDARVIASKICDIHNAVLIKGSATPGVDSYYNALINDSVVTLSNRFNNVNLAKVSVIDMREEYYKGHSPVFSNILINEIIQTLKNKKQVILLMNRRGFYTGVQCKSCGELLRCPSCDIPLIYHADDKTLKCHWCNYGMSVPDKCPYCGGTEIKMFGTGTQRIESIAAKLFPDAKIERADSDIMNSKTKYIEILNRFQNGETDILIGTQMIAKGLDNKNVTLVGVIDSDTGFSFPDFRSSERGFQLLMQVAGRAGRGEFPGKVIFQTYNPDLYALKNAKSQNYIDFYNEEIERRKTFNYPPFCKIIKLVFSSIDESRVYKCAQETARMLKNKIEKLNLCEKIEITDAVKCIMYKINKEYRYQIIIKNNAGKQGQYFVFMFVKNTKCANDIKMIVDTDPVDII